MEQAFGIITSASKLTRVEEMEKYRPVGAFSILGRYRVIDFPISNMSNSDIDRIHVYIGDNNPRSLVEHVGTGRHYNINSKHGKVQMLFSDSARKDNLYNTDINAFQENIEIIQRMPQPYVVITPSYMVFRQDFNALLQTHLESGADITLLYHKTDDARENFLNTYVVNLNKQKGVLSLERNSGTAKEKNIFMDTYIMKKDLFLDLISKAKKVSSIYQLVQIVNDSCNDLDIRGVAHRGFFAAITDFRSYYKAQMEMLDYNVAKVLFENNWPIYTRTTDSCPTKYVDGAKVTNSFVSNGCLVEGTIENSIIGRGVTVSRGAVIRNSVILAYSVIGEDVTVENQVIDKWAKITHVKELMSTPENPGYVYRDDII